MTGTTRRAQPTTLPISLQWRLIENLPDQRYQAEVTLTNVAGFPLGADWALYFNSASRLFPETVSSAFTLSHINGDFFVLRAKRGELPICPGESRAIQWQGGPWAINVGDAPSGFYFVPNDASPVPVTIPVPLRIGPFPPAEKLKRGASDAVPVVTCQSRYAANQALKLLPVENLIPVVPTPCEITARPGVVTLNGSIVIHYDQPLATEAQYLATDLELLLGTAPVMDCRLPASHNADTIQLRIGEVKVNGSAKEAGDEAYRLVARPDRGIEIVGTDSAGVFYGVQTLRALLSVSTGHSDRERVINAVRIADAPRFRYRGLHLDVARNFQSADTVKRLLDLMAFYKLNRFHWHLTDDEGWRIEIRALPELTAVGARRGHTRDEAEHLVPSHGSGPFADAAFSPGNGFYSQDDLLGILQYAKARHIAVIPELDFPGHARAAIKAMKARHRRLLASGAIDAASEFLLQEPGDGSRYESEQRWRDNVVDVGLDSTYRFLSTVVHEIAAVYRRADVPLTTIHLGGDEVPLGAWEGSAACQRIALDAASTIPPRGQLELYFLNRVSEILTRESIQPACWEDCPLLAIGERPSAGGARRNRLTTPPTTYVWDNVWGRGREDAAYRLANAGFDVVLANATHLYFDLAYEKDPDEPGYYWAGFVDARTTFEFAPLDVLDSPRKDRLAKCISQTSVAHPQSIEQGASHIVGIQGQLWGESLRSPERLEYVAFPRVIALAERAWARSPGWAQINDPVERQCRLDEDWNQFANRLGQRELPRLDYLAGGVHYRLPPPGAVVRDGVLQANVAYPGLWIRYTTDGSEPTSKSTLYEAPVPVGGTVRLKTFDTRGRGSRTVIIGSRKDVDW